MALNPVQLGQLTIPQSKGVMPKVGGLSFGQSQPLGPDLNISKPELNIFGQLRPNRTGEIVSAKNGKEGQLAQKLDFDA